MKKLVALLMALVLALSCTAAFAEEAAAATGTMTGLSVALDENYVKSLAGAMDPDGSLGYAQAADAFLQVLDNLGIYVVPAYPSCPACSRTMPSAPRASASPICSFPPILSTTSPSPRKR